MLATIKRSLELVGNLPAGTLVIFNNEVCGTTDNSSFPLYNLEKGCLIPAESYQFQVGRLLETETVTLQNGVRGE